MWQRMSGRGAWGWSLVVLLALLSSACDRPVTTVGESDFAVLAQAAEGYAEARPGHVLEFPRDHGPHPEFRIEWWYLTANLEGADGQLYGAQWTLFRSAVQPPGSFQADNPWQSEQVYMAHFALTSPQRHFAFQRYARGGWHSDQARTAAQQGAKVIMSPASRTYMDMKYDASTPLGLDWAGWVDVKQAYTWDPATQVTGVSESDVLGVEAALWSETVQTIEDIEFMTFPRLPGYAEIGWSPETGRSWDEYRTRLATHGPRLAALGVNFYRSPLVPWP